MKKLGSITRIIGWLIRYAPVVIVIVQALEMIKTEIQKLSADDE